jgi:histidinol-phosphate aminotransferase
MSELERELGLSTIIKLASNENPKGPSQKVVSAMQTVLAEVSRYPDGNGFSLKAALAQHLAVESTQITLGNGSNDVLEIIARTFVSERSEVIFSEYAFAVYPIVTQAMGAQAVISKASAGGEYPCYGHDLSAMLEQVTEKTKLVFIANPNNPTGTFLTSKQLYGFLSDLPKQVICVLDEAYFEYVSPDERSDSIAWLTRFPNLIITRTFSKAYGLAGMRIGYSVSSSEMADLLNRVRQPFNTNLVALSAAEAALADGEYLRETIALNAQGMGQLTTAFSELGLSWIPSRGNFITVDLGRSAMPIYEELLVAGVIVRPVANYGLPHFLRISIGTEAENLFFINALTRILD